jgi:hypothetical protein
VHDVQARGVQDAVHQETSSMRRDVGLCGRGEGLGGVPAQCHDELLQRGRLDSQSLRAGRGAGSGARRADDGPGLRVERFGVQHLPAVAEGAHLVSGPGDGERTVPQALRVLGEQDPSPVDQQHALQQVTDLLDEVGRAHDRPRLLGVGGDQPVVGQLPADGVQTHR